MTVVFFVQVILKILVVNCYVLRRFLFFSPCLNSKFVAKLVEWKDRIFVCRVRFLVAKLLQGEWIFIVFGSSPPTVAGRTNFVSACSIPRRQTVVFWLVNACSIK